MSAPPPSPPGPGMHWVRNEDFVEEQVADLIRQIDQTIAEQDPVTQALMLRDRAHVVTKAEAMVRLHYMREAGQ
jgi:hypothetical protein